MSSPTSTGARSMPVSIQPLEVSDIPDCARLSAAAFARDPHTLVKQLGQQPFDMFDITRSGLEENLKRDNFLCVKAVDNQGIIVGHANWVFSGGGQKRASSRGTGSRGIGDSESAVAGEEDNKATELGKPQAPANAAEDVRDPIERLHALEDADMQYWLQNIVPADTPCILVVGLAVSPSHERRGIGTALLSHGNTIADERGLSIWVHSSHQAYNAYIKAGFETRRELRIELDDYAPRPPRDGELTMAALAGRDEDGRWGRYVIRYMERKTGGNRGN
ncbi:acyl-CoA N-acyltransferase [Xylaria bambusicola]|uniref:acyl-CoA N-acyltransferase n=1 Tax=Xylaria bambusicola TaxID=326684 RepID=UPI0020082709|nr:acyl-CoA N-acyltransferase [Xylaria bambusicola]KAI0506836.1 acyl-CoA N-acyltransferase [Xylaria bambusicola]